MSKMVVVAVGVAAYVLGTRAGRERYEQMRNAAQRLWRDPRVERGRTEAGRAIKENAPVAKEKVVDAVSSAADKAGWHRSDDDHGGHGESST